MNEISETLKLGSYFLDKVAWGARAGHQTRLRLTDYIAARPAVGVFKLSLQGMKRIDTAFAAEAIVGLVADHCGSRPICVVDLSDADLRANLAAAAQQSRVSVMVWQGAEGEALGLRAGSAAHQALTFALRRGEVRAADFSAEAGVSISNASTRFNKLWRASLLLRQEHTASSGGKEYVYRPVQ